MEYPLSVISQTTLCNSTTIDETNAIAYFNIYPNPSQGEIIISNNNEKIISINVMDILGRTVKNIKTIPVDEIKINLEKALWFIQINTVTNSIVKKVLVE